MAPALLLFLQDQDPQTRRLACRALSNMAPDHPLVETVVNLLWEWWLEEEEEEKRWFWAFCIARLGSDRPEVVEVLLETARQEVDGLNDEFREALAFGLLPLLHQSSTAKPAMETMFSLLTFFQTIFSNIY